MRRSTVETLPEIVLDLREHALGLDEDDAFDVDQDDDLDEEGENIEDRREPYVRATPKVGRNDPCPCGSGKKYKKCCLA
jgi:preprotein translocase subunit SecA